MTSVEIFGGLSVDHLVTEGLGAHFSVLGGPALYASFGASRVAGVEVNVCTSLPIDEPRFKAEFDQARIGYPQSDEIDDCPRVWILNDSAGRMLVPVGGWGETELQTGPKHQSETDSSWFESVNTSSADAVLLSSPPPGVDLSGYKGIVGIDPHQSHVASLGLEYFQSYAHPNLVFLPSRLQLTLIDPDINRAIEQIRNATGAFVLARLDEEGMLAVSPAGSIQLRDSDVRVIDTTGAGDSSAGGIIAALARGDSLENAAAMGLTVVRQLLKDWGHEGLKEDGKFDFADNANITRTNKSIENRSRS